MKKGKARNYEGIKLAFDEIIRNYNFREHTKLNDLAGKYHFDKSFLPLCVDIGIIEKEDFGVYRVTKPYSPQIVDAVYYEKNRKYEKPKPIDKQEQLSQVPETIQTDNSFVRFVNTPIKTNYTPDSATATGFSITNDSIDDDYLHELKPMNRDEILAGIYERLAEEFMNLSKFYSK